jgi:hypothetical protein
MEIKVAETWSLAEVEEALTDQLVSGNELILAKRRASATPQGARSHGQFWI